MLLLILFESCRESPIVDRELMKFNKRETSFQQEVRRSPKGKFNPFYMSAKEKEKELGLDSLENGFESLQIRVWYDNVYSNKQKLITITYESQKWEAKLYTAKPKSSQEYVLSNDPKSLTPKMGWDKFSNRLLNLNILTLPDGVELENCGAGGGDGSGYNIEIATQKHYRFYTYLEPQDYADECSYAKNMIAILNLLDHNFGIHEAQHTTMHWQNTGQDVVTSSSAILQVWFGAGPFSFKLNCYFQLYVLNYH